MYNAEYYIKGDIAFGDFSIGALAVGKYANGDNAKAAIALADTAGSIYQKIGQLSPWEITTV